MSIAKVLAVLATVAVAVVVAVYGVAYLAATQASSAGALPERADLSIEVPAATTQIAFWSKRVVERPRAYLDLTLLGQAYARRARETSDVGQYTRAEAALRSALGTNPEYVPASASLAGVLLALHDFEGALATARPIADRPQGVQALATIGDAYLALGRYRHAQNAYGELFAWRQSASAYARLAFLADLRGNTEQARRSMERAARLAEESGENGESLAWYTFQLGELAYRAGETDLAKTRYEAALDIFPDYPLALSGLAKTCAARGDLAAAIRIYKRLTAVVPQPDYVAALGDVYAAVGDAASAREQYGTVEVIARLARANRQVYNRQLANFYSDHDVRIGEASRLALGELRVRRDVYGYDAAAWASLKSGRLAEARNLMRHALSKGTRDVRLYYHAGMVAVAQGRTADARRLLSAALDLNPHFDPLQAPIARKALLELR